MGVSVGAIGVMVGVVVGVSVGILRPVYWSAWWWACRVATGVLVSVVVGVSVGGIRVLVGVGVSVLGTTHPNIHRRRYRTRYCWQELFRLHFE